MINLRINIVVGVLERVSKFLSRTDVSAVIFVIIEYLKLSFDHAFSLRKSYLTKNQTIAKEIKEKYIFSFVDQYPVESAYINDYVLPSLQFTSIFQVGSNIFLVRYNNVIVRGFLKATSSMSVIVLKQVESNKTLDFYKSILPFSKEPAVSVCRLALPDDVFIPEGFMLPYTQKSIKKFVCNLAGEISHNVGKEGFGMQKLHVSELAQNMPIKALWKTMHQFAEDVFVDKFGNPIGFYIGSIVPRSWGNAFLESFTVNGIPISTLYASTTEYFFDIMPLNVTSVLSTFSIFADET